MVSKGMMGGGAILVAILLAATEGMQLPGYLNYIWAALILIWGIMAFKE